MRKAPPMDRDEFLSIPALARKIHKKEIRLEYLRTKAEGDGALQLRERVQTSPSDKASAIADIMVDLSIEIDGLRDELRILRLRAEKLIDKLDGEELLVMRLHYLRGLTWPEIAEAMVYDRSTVFRRQQSAMDKLFGNQTPFRFRDEE